MTSKDAVRPTVRFGPRQYRLIQEKLKERDVTFQSYCIELICRDLGVPVKEFEDLEAEGQLSFFSEDETSETALGEDKTLPCNGRE